jgi:tetratricopeptide (TPR) repeat protein
VKKFRDLLDQRRVREFADTGRRLVLERAEAPRIVGALLQNTARADWPGLSELSELQTAGALEYLGNHFSEFLTKDAAHAKAIADLAVAAAEAMPDTAYPAIVIGQLRAHAWKDLGKALRFLGKNEEAVASFTTAERCLEIGGGTLAHDRAIVRFNLAMSLQETNRFAESRRVLAESKQVFREHGDPKNATLCTFSEGVLLQRMKRFREAREVYLLLLAASPDLEQESRAATHHAIGFCSIELGDFEDADVNLSWSMKLFRELGQPVSVLKAQAGRGRLLIRSGHPARGIELFRDIRRSFLSRGLHEEAGLCGLEIVEGLLVIGHASQAETLARKLVREFTVAGLNTRAITALGYLSEAITAKEAKPSLAVQVREYIVSLRTNPERDFRTPLQS